MFHSLKGVPNSQVVLGIATNCSPQYDSGALVYKYWSMCISPGAQYFNNQYSTIDSKDLPPAGSILIKSQGTYILFIGQSKLL